MCFLLTAEKMDASSHQLNLWLLLDLGDEGRTLIDLAWVTCLSFNHNQFQSWGDEVLLLASPGSQNWGLGNQVS